MRTVTGVRQDEQAHVAALADRFLEFFPVLSDDGRKVAVTLYRLLAKGEPVATSALADASHVAVDTVRSLLDGWPGVYREDDRVIGFWGLTPREFSSHRFKVDGRTLYAWCAWDALFLPQILGRVGTVESVDAQSGEAIRLIVTPEGVESVTPSSAVISMLEPYEDMMEDVVARLCHYLHFFSSRESGEAWIAEHPGTLLMSINDAFLLGRLKNERQLQEALRLPLE